MPDMLVKLYELPDLEPVIEKVSQEGVTIRPPVAAEKSKLIDWVTQTFGPRWAKECEVAFSSLPATCFIAIKNAAIIGFACYECTANNFFGPTGVSEEKRGDGIGRALLLSCLHAMKKMGYGYAIIGGVGPAEFYTNAVGATIIEGSESSIYAERLSDEN